METIIEQEIYHFLIIIMGLEYSYKYTFYKTDLDGINSRLYLQVKLFSSPDFNDTITRHKFQNPQSK